MTRPLEEFARRMLGGPVPRLRQILREQAARCRRLESGLEVLAHPGAVGWRVEEAERRIAALERARRELGARVEELRAARAAARRRKTGELIERIRARGDVPAEAELETLRREVAGMEERLAERIQVAARLARDLAAKGGVSAEVLAALRALVREDPESAARFLREGLSVWGSDARLERTWDLESDPLREEPA